jgi:hypothetical protein
VFSCVLKIKTRAPRFVDAVCEASDIRKAPSPGWVSGVLMGALDGKKSAERGRVRVSCSKFCSKLLIWREEINKYNLQW